MPGPDNLRDTLLDPGYAPPASTYSHFGWAVEEGPADRMAALDVFEAQVGDADRTIAWGGSLGGVVTGAIVDRYADRIDGAIPVCHGLGGTTAQWNQLLDATFVVDQLIAPEADLDLGDLPPYPGPTPPDAATAAALLQQGPGDAGGPDADRARAGDEQLPAVGRPGRPRAGAARHRCPAGAAVRRAAELRPPRQGGAAAGARVPRRRQLLLDL